MPRIPNRRDDDREPIAPDPATPIAEAPPAPVAPAVATPPGDLPPLPADQEGSDPAVADDSTAPPPPSAPLPPIVPTEVHAAEADLLLADAEDPPRAAPARGWRADAQRIYRMVSDELLLVTGGKRLPTIDEIDRAIEGAVARRAPRRGEAPSALPQASSETEAAADRLAAEALDPAWAGDPAVFARARHAVKEMLGSGASEDEVRGMLAETGTRDWLNQYAAQIGEEWGGEDVGEPAADLIPAAWQSPSSGPAPNPAPVSNGSSSGSGTILPPLSDAATIQSIMGDPVRRSQYVELVNGTPALINNILIDEIVYAAVNDALLDQLNILPPQPQAAQSGAQASGKKAAQNGVAPSSGLSVLTIADQKSLDGIEKIMMKNFTTKMKSNSMHFKLDPLSPYQKLRSFSRRVATITLSARVNALFVGERYVAIARRESDGKLFITSVATGAEQGGSASHMSGFSRGPKLPAGYKIVALLHTHATGHKLKNPNTGQKTDTIDPKPGPGDPMSVWYENIPSYVASYKGDWSKPFDPAKVVVYEVSRDGKPKKKNPDMIEYRTIVNAIDVTGNATLDKNASTHIGGWNFKNWKVKKQKH